MQRVLKKLFSNEASLLFYHPVPADEKEYHKIVERPISFSEIDAAVGANAYAGSYAAFHADVERLLSNAFLFNEDDTLYWIGACMLQKELHDVVDEFKAAGVSALLIKPSATSSGHQNETPPGDEWGDEEEE